MSAGYPIFMDMFMVEAAKYPAEWNAGIGEYQMKCQSDANMEKERKENRDKNFHLADEDKDGHLNLKEFRNFIDMEMKNDCVIAKVPFKQSYL
mmetsp:Transcript_40599/g.29217  ORF Transcript_40599/g.29217 Transcript_40599/m.29217 type:complete len:93 (-) Transcript_40599:826-1104(-)